MPDGRLRAEVNNYFKSLLGRRPTAKEAHAAAEKPISRYPVLVDQYIRQKEDDGDRAESNASEKVADNRRVLVDQVNQVLADLKRPTDFCDRPWTS